MIRPALLAAPLLALSLGAATAQSPEGAVRSADPGGRPAMQTIVCHPATGQVTARFSQRAGTHAGWTWLDLRLTAEGRRPLFTRVTRDGQIAWQGFVNPGQPQSVTLGNGDGRITNQAVSQATTVVCGIAPPGG